jgi:hypothetical protein
MVKAQMVVAAGRGLRGSRIGNIGPNDMVEHTVQASLKVDPVIKLSR